MVKLLSILFLFIFLNACGVFRTIPQPEREFRGFWVATVVNIDWPKNGNDAVTKQKSDFLEILNFYQNLNFNAAIVQIRTAGDAFYASKYAPWSRYLTGEEGKAPDTNENLLKWMINETQKRGMEFHAWLNPYRATFDLKTEQLSQEHDFNVHPEWMVQYGKKYYYDPGLPEVQEHMADIITEVVSNYDIDAVHFDDYFYPYTIKDEIFQDSITFYNCALPDQNLEDWRRSNIDSLIKKSYSSIKKNKQWVQFGVSPFGVWKNNSTDPKGSDTNAGQTTYDDLYADPLLWIDNGWLDYFIPQVYWSMELPVASHRKIVDWWSSTGEHTNLYIGNGPYKIRNNSDSAWNKKKELPNQIEYGRANPKIKGHAFFSAKSLMNSNNDVVKHLKNRFYKTAALTPVSPAAPEQINDPIDFNISRSENGLVKLQNQGLNSSRFVMVYQSNKNPKKAYSLKKLIAKIDIKNQESFKLPANITKNRKHIGLTFIDLYGRESTPIIVHLKQIN